MAAPDTPVTTRSIGPVVGAIAVAVAAALVAVYALGLSLATRNGTGVSVSSDGVSAAADGPAEGETVTVALSEFAIAPADITVPAGSTLAVTNDGEAEHNLVVVDTEVRTSNLAPGDAEDLELTTLAPGTYEFLCDLPGHATAGMTGTLTVGDGGEATASGGDDMGMDHEDMTGSGSGAAMQAEMEQLMRESIEAFPAATDGVGAATMEPEVLEDGTKLFELVVDEVAWEVEPGKVVDAIGYNGMVPGPTMHVDVGDEVIIRVVNELDDQGTSLHPHGVKDHDFEVDGVTYVSQEPIATGESMDYRFTMTEEAVATYHSHHMSLKQVPNGLFGAMIVGDWAQISGFDDVVDEQVMILNDAGNIGFSLNGKSFPATTPYQYEAGDRVIVHYANEGQVAHPMHLHNQKGTVIAKDGYPLPEGARYSGDTFNVAPGERLTVVYEMDNPGTWVWHCHILSHVKRSDGSMFGMLTAVVVTEPDA